MPDQKIGIYFDFQIESLIREFKEFLEVKLMDSKVDSRLISIPTDFKECNKVFAPKGSLIALTNSYQATVQSKGTTEGH